MTVDLQAGRFYGGTTSQALAGAILSIVTHDREWRLPAHTHELPFLCLLLEGLYEEEAAGRAIRYQPLTLVFHPANLSHTDLVFPGSKMFTIEFSNRWDDALAQYAPAHHSLFAHTGAEPLWIALRLYQGVREGTLTELTVETLCYELIGSFERMDDSDRSTVLVWLQSLRDSLDERYAAPIDIAAIARETGVHPVHLTRQFRRAYGLNIGDYVHHRRIQQACRLLRESNISIAEIAGSLGYTDQSHFTKIFGAITGRTPARYRRG